MRWPRASWRRHYDEQTRGVSAWVAQAVKERPILFSSPMVVAILEGRKSQTRRLVKPGGPRWGPDDRPDTRLGTPYGAPGDRLWVKEAIRLDRTEAERDWNGERAWASYVADGSPTKLDSWGWKLSTLPSMFLPRGLSRITLEVTGVRAERLQDISEEDAKAEGVEAHDDDGVTYYGPLNRGHASARVAFERLWESINGEGSWDANPWCWVIGFRRVE